MDVFSLPGQSAHIDPPPPQGQTSDNGDALAQQPSHGSQRRMIRTRIVRCRADLPTVVFTKTEEPADYEAIAASTVARTAPTTSLSGPLNTPVLRVARNYAVHESEFVPKSKQHPAQKRQRGSSHTGINAEYVDDKMAVCDEPPAPSHQEPLLGAPNYHYRFPASQMQEYGAVPAGPVPSLPPPYPNPGFGLGDGPLSAPPVPNIQLGGDSLRRPSLSSTSGASTLSSVNSIDSGWSMLNSLSYPILRQINNADSAETSHSNDMGPEQTYGPSRYPTPRSVSPNLDRRMSYGPGTQLGGVGHHQSQLADRNLDGYHNLWNPWKQNHPLFRVGSLTIESGTDTDLESRMDSDVKPDLAQLSREQQVSESLMTGAEAECGEESISEDEFELGYP